MLRYSINSICYINKFIDIFIDVNVYFFGYLSCFQKKQKAQEVLDNFLCLLPEFLIVFFYLLYFYFSASKTIWPSAIFIDHLPL